MDNTSIESLSYPQDSSFFQPTTYSRYEIAGGFYLALAYASDRSGLIENSLLYSSGIDTGVLASSLDMMLSDEEYTSIFSCVGNLQIQSDHVGGMFPSELQHGAKNAYGELMDNILWAGYAAAKNGGVTPKSEVKLRGGRTISLRSFSFDEIITTASLLHETVERIHFGVSDMFSPQVVRANERGSVGIYSIGSQGQVLATLRPSRQEQYDRRIEHGNSNGAEASIGFTVELDGGYVNPDIEMQKDVFNIRVDNEGDKLSLDVGSILANRNSFSRKVAELLTVGESYRLLDEHNIRANLPPSLNHNRYTFHSELAEPQKFAQIVAGLAAKYENSFQANRSRIHGALLIEAQKAAS
jgi:hypothetical protein